MNNQIEELTEIDNNEENNKNGTIELIILIIFVISLLAATVKTYKYIESVPPLQWGQCGLGGMTDQERKDCIKKQEIKKQKAEQAENFLKENQSTGYIISIICLIGSITGMVIGKKAKLSLGYSVLGVLSIIFSVVLLL